MDTPDDLFGLNFATSWGTSLAPLKRKGEIWKIANPTEGTMWWIDGCAITWAMADRPFMKKIAEEWINTMLSPEFQVNHFLRELSMYPVVTNIKEKLTEEEKKQFLSVTIKRILAPIYSVRDRNGLKALWDEAMKNIQIEGKKNND